MRSVKLVPAAPVSPGDVLRKKILGLEVDGKKITQELLADAMRVSRFSINQIINGRRSVTAEMALRLAKALGTTPEFWLNLQREVDLHESRTKLKEKLERIEVLRLGTIKYKMI